MKLLYFYINFFSVLVPFLFSFHPKIKFYKEWRAFLPANILTALIFLVWDGIFTHNQVWGFNSTYITGITFFKLPIEEILFFICIPYACVFTFFCLTKFFKLEMPKKYVDILSLIISIALFITGILYYDRAYTFISFISLSILLPLLHFGLKISWLGKLYYVYPVLLIPFFIVNGILTGTGLESPVVWYNNSENIGIRLLTIPFEDIFYGFEMILLNILFFDIFSKKLNPEKVIF